MPRITKKFSDKQCYVEKFSHNNVCQYQGLKTSENCEKKLHYSKDLRFNLATKLDQSYHIKNVEQEEKVMERFLKSLGRKKDKRKDVSEQTDASNKQKKNSFYEESHLRDPRAGHFEKISETLKVFYEYDNAL